MSNPNFSVKPPEAQAIIRIIVTGGRTGVSQDLTQFILDAAAQFFGLWDYHEDGVRKDSRHRLIVVHGDNPRPTCVDQHAKRWALENGVADEPHPADWERYGKAAGSARNQEMVDLGARLTIGFPGPDSVGTYDCLRRSRKARIPCWEIGPMP